MKSLIIALIFVISIFTFAAFGDDATDYYNSGVAKAQKNDFAGAIIDFDKAIELKPDFAEAYDKRAMARGPLLVGPT